MDVKVIVQPDERQVYSESKRIIILKDKPEED